MTDPAETCDACGKVDSGISWWGPAFRKKELRAGRPDPGNLCGKCSGSVDGKRIGEQVAIETASR
jgi:hypothetical protein